VIIINVLKKKQRTDCENYSEFNDKKIYQVDQINIGEVTTGYFGGDLSEIKGN
jgi:hypothetical protein